MYLKLKFFFYFFIFCIDINILAWVVMMVLYYIKRKGIENEMHSLNCYLRIIPFYINKKKEEIIERK
jgi:hypothetical protein